MWYLIINKLLEGGLSDEAVSKSEIKKDVLPHSFSAALHGLRHVPDFFSFLGSYISRSYERQAQESARQLLGTASEYVDLAVLDLGRAMQQLLWNTDITGAILVPDEVSYARKVEIVKALSTFQQDYPLVDRAYLLTYSNQALYDASGTILPIKDAPQRAFLAEFNSHIQPRVVGDETFSTVVLTLDGKVALLQDFPTPEKNGAPSGGNP